MGFQVFPNAHVKIWVNGSLPPAPPAGAATFDGAAQLLVPILSGASTKPYRHRCALAPGAIAITTMDILAAATQCWLSVIDDLGGIQDAMYYKIVDMSVSTQEIIAVPGTYEVTALFLSFIISD